MGADPAIEKPTYEALAKDLEKFKLAMDNVADDIIITDPEGIVVYANKAVERVTGYKAEEAIGKKSGALWKTPMPSNYYQRMWDTIKTQKKVFIGEIQNKRKNGEVYTAMMSITPVLDKKGEIEFFVGVERDITKEKEIDRTKSEFISFASHQLKTPPTAIKLLTERLLGDKIGTLNLKQKEYFNDIRSENQRMIDLVDAFLNVSRIEMGIFAVHVTEKDAGAIVRSVVLELNPFAAKQNIQLKESYPAAEIRMAVDETLLRAVVGNLLMNAIRYTPPGGTIQVTCKTMERGQVLDGRTLQENSFVIIVSDTGCGIQKDQQDKIFTRFFRADNARKRHPDGTGLGLYIVKSVLDHSGGSVWFTSEENKGTTFCVAIPMTGMKLTGDIQ